MLAIQTHTTTVHGRLRLCLERCFRFIVKEEENCLSDFFYMKFPKRQNYGDLKHQWFGGKGSEECTEGLQGREKTWYDVLMRDTCHQTFTESVDIQHQGWTLIKLWNLNDNYMSVKVHQLQQMDHFGAGWWQSRATGGIT